MRPRFFLRFFLFSLTAIIILSVATAYAANIVINPSSVGYSSTNVTANDLKPAECNGQLLDGIVSSAPFTGDGNDLILGSAGDDTIAATGGDCIVAGGGNDTITGSAGDEVFLGGDGTDTCTSGGGTDAFYSCETIN